MSPTDESDGTRKRGGTRVRTDSGDPAITRVRHGGSRVGKGAADAGDGASETEPAVGSEPGSTPGGAIRRRNAKTAVIGTASDVLRGTPKRGTAAPAAGTPAGAEEEGFRRTAAAGPGTRPVARPGPGSTLAQRADHLRGVDVHVALPSLPGERPFDTHAARLDGKYLLGDVLGEGGMGRVVAARDLDLGRTVALKTLREGHERDPALIRALLFEARITGQLEHPHIVPVHDVGVLEDGSVFYTMKLVGDLSLKDVLVQLRDGNEFAARTYTLPRLLQYFRGICLAVEYAHARGVVHRDLKPDNVLIGEYGEVHIMDWGIARVLPLEPGEPGWFAGAPEDPGLVAGTPHYMSPEQARGETHLVDARSDVYSLGVILYQILTLALPFDTTTTKEQMDALLTRPVPPPRKRAPKRAIPEELERICMKALSPRREGRYASAIAIWSDIESYLEGKKEAERLQALAEEQVVEADRAAGRFFEVRSRLEELEERVRHDERTAGHFDALPERREAWERRLRVDHIRLVEARVFAEAVTGYNQALAYQRNHRKALEGLAALYREKAEDARRRGDEPTMVLYGDLARRATSQTAPEAPATLSVRSYPEGATLRLFELGDASEIDESRARSLGPAPASDLVLAPGSYLVSAQLPGFRETRVPVVLSAGQDQTILVSVRPWSVGVPLVGHADELTAIKETFTSAVAEGKLRSMLVCGEAGLGKGKLLAEVDRYLDELPELVIFAFARCRPLHRHVPFLAASEVLRHRFGISPHDPPETARGRIAQAVRHAFTKKGTEPPAEATEARVERTVSLLASLPGMGVEAGEDRPSGPEHTRRVFDAVTDVFRAYADLDPVVLTLRGAQYLDRLSRDLLQALAEGLADRPVFCLAFTRNANALALPFQRTLRLRPFDEEGVRHQLQILLRGPVSSVLLDLVLVKAGGNPFSIAELARHLVQDERIRWTGRHWDLVFGDEKAAELASMTMEDVLLHEIRRLDEDVIDVAEAAAVCGRRFWAGQVGSLVGQKVDRALALLEDREIVTPLPASRHPGEEEYAFRHDGVRDALYEKVPVSTRAVHHGSAAKWLDRQPRRNLEVVATIAHHLVAAGRNAEAAPYRAELAREAARWERPDAPDWFAWPRDTRSGVHG